MPLVTEQRAAEKQCYVTGAEALPPLLAYVLQLLTVWPLPPDDSATTAMTPQQSYSYAGLHEPNTAVSFGHKSEALLNAYSFKIPFPSPPAK